MGKAQAIIIGAGPAGLTAAYELLERSEITPIVLEADCVVGGIARTVRYRGNSIDIGGHRFFSKSDRVMDWWLARMPLAPSAGGGGGQEAACALGERDAVGSAPEALMDRQMLVRRRKSRIYYLRRFFDYPVSLNRTTVGNLGLARMIRIGASYLKARAFPIWPEENLEQFLVNRFGRELYGTFFQSYTEKVWGVPCQKISAAWGAQRIKGLSITKALAHALRGVLRSLTAAPTSGIVHGGGRVLSVAPSSIGGWNDRDSRASRSSGDIRQKGTETSLIEQFLYPKYGPGQMWELVADEVERRGGQVLMEHAVTRLHVENNRVAAVDAVDRRSGRTKTFSGDWVFSTMPVRDLVRAVPGKVPPSVREVAEGLQYRDFITVGLLARRLKVRDPRHPAGLIQDNWIYVQEPDVRVGRLQIFNNWSPYLVADPNTVWLGLEYFCNEGDDLWQLSDRAMADLGREELARIGILDPADALDATVLRMPKTYPAYFGAYERFEEIRAWLDGLENLFPIGRNGMHHYNNQDHSMLTAMVAVDNILAGRSDKSNLWQVNTEQEYHESKR